MASSKGDHVSSIIALPVVGLAIYGLFRLYRYLDQKNQQAIQDYSQQWICLRCGNSFIP